MLTLHKVLRLGSALVTLFAAKCAFAQSGLPDIATVEPDLVVPAMTEAAPAGGLRVKQTHPDWAETKVYHALYLPQKWMSGDGKKWPVVIELPGNGPYKNRFNDISTGRPEGCKLGYGITAGKGAIWASAPYLNGAGDEIKTQWWGNKPTHDPKPTVVYLKALVSWICKDFGGDPKRVLLVGFSRGGIACNFIGLHDDEVAKLWCGMVAYSHYDGVRKWGYPNSDRESALIRLKRLGNRPQFICHEQNGIEATRSYLESTGVTGNFTFQPTGFRNHNDAWTLRPSPAREKLRAWLAEVWQ